MLHILPIHLALWYQVLQELPWFSSMWQDLLILIGDCAFLGRIGVILRTMTGLRPRLTPFAAFGLTLMMIITAVVHIARGEYDFLAINLLSGGVAAFITH
jgi:hypothetical protein